ncbi:MAG: type II secretion system GspH family protein [bacterium]|nr:type II secretion system GspH family protein [bacterium]
MIKRRGVTMVELLVVIVISTIIGGAIVTTLMGQMRLSTTQNRTMINQQNLREGLDYITDEVSTIGSGVNEPFVSIATAQEFEFNSDIDGDGNWNRVRYYMSGSDLMRQLWTSTNQGGLWTQVSNDVLLSGVTTLTFAYFQAGNTTTTTANSITLVDVQLTQNAGADTTAFTTGQVATGRMAARATIRNRML